MKKLFELFPLHWKEFLIILIAPSALFAGYLFFSKGKDFQEVRFLVELSLLPISMWSLMALQIGVKNHGRLVWFMRASTIKIRQLEAQLQPATDAPARTTHWPWGEHHTELLGHLEAAAQNFWVLYDPSDPSTAPTNEMVSDWLRTERGVSKDKSQAIASILRADGLRTGPRR